MPAKRELTMRQIRQMLRLARDGVSAREIGRTLGVARSTIQDNLKRATVAGLAWPLAGDLTDAALEQRLFAHAGAKRGFRRRTEPDWGSLACELKRPGVNLMVLWEEYRAVHPGGYGYSRFCDLFREFERRLSPTMRQDHPAGDKVFVDYSGKKIMIVDRATGAAGNICDNRARLEAFRSNPRLQIVRPALSTRASIHFNTWRRSSYVVRMVVHCEHPCRR